MVTITDNAYKELDFRKVGIGEVFMFSAYYYMKIGEYKKDNSCKAVCLNDGIISEFNDITPVFIADAEIIFNSYTGKK